METEVTTTAHERAADHTAVLATAGDRAFELIADVTRWPVLFSPCLAATVLENSPGRERIRL
ncbi:MAG: hypothetical protein QOF98_506, partial [Streptomyces sp.]|nr:hypothetical protein [Streptomyces sp.]